MGACVSQEARSSNQDAAVTTNASPQQQQVVRTETVVVHRAVEINETALPRGSWYGSGGWLPRGDVMDQWRDDLIKHSYDELKQSQFDRIIDLAHSEVLDTVAKGVDAWVDSKEESEFNELVVSARIKQLEITQDTDPITELYKLMTDDDIIRSLVKKMINEANRNLIDPLKGREPDFKGLIKTPEDIIAALRRIVKQQPFFYGDHLVGVPMAALFTNVNGTVSGQALFQLDKWNDAIFKVVNYYGITLDLPVSWPEDTPWLDKKAQSHPNTGWNRNFEGEPIVGKDGSIWVWPDKPKPYWNCWNAWFSRDIKPEARPVAGTNPMNHNIITSCNDGQEFRWRSNVQLLDTFWLKNMPYSFKDIFGKHESKYAKQFENGFVFQTFLNPYNYHQWWSPVSGKIVLYDVLPGLAFSKLILPDIDGGTTASCPYLTEVNARGLLIIDTTGYADIGLVCCVPIGMVEVSSIRFSKKYVIENKNGIIEKGAHIGKFKFGGSSSFALLFEDTTKYNKILTFMADHVLNDNNGSKYFPQDPPPAQVNGGGLDVQVGMQIAVVSSY